MGYTYRIDPFILSDLQLLLLGDSLERMEAKDELRQRSMRGHLSYLRVKSLVLALTDSEDQADREASEFVAECLRKNVDFM